MPPKPALPQFLVSNYDSSLVESLPEPSNRLDRQPLSIRDAVPRTTSTADGPFDVPGIPDSPPIHRVPPSRTSTLDLDTNSGQRTFPISSVKATQDEVDPNLQRSHTQGFVDVSTSGWQTESDSFEKPSRSHTEKSVGSSKSNRGTDLGDQISTEMTNTGKIGLDEPKSYIAEDKLSTLVADSTDKSIRKALKLDVAADDLITFAKQNPKVLALTLLVFVEKTSRNRAITAFKLHSFTDACLPVVEDMLSEKVCLVKFEYPDSDDSDNESDTCNSSSQSLIESKCRHRRAVNAFHSPPWKASVFTTFFEKQWSFCVPKIDGHVFEYHLGDYDILPFRKENCDIKTKASGGHFGDVRLATMLATHQTAIVTDRETIPVAVKEMKAHIGQEYDNVGNWRRETKALKVFNGLHNQHTVRGIGAFTQRGKYFILMEWADSGDLEDVWEKTPHPQLNLTATRVAQFLEQFRGLANTLNQMHDYKVESDNSVVIPKNEETEAGSAFGDTKSAEAAGDGLPPHDKKVHFETPQVKIEINEPSGGTENWRHGDLKPGNILSFTEGHSSCWLGTLKLADLGRAKQHMDKTGKRVGTSEMFSTLPYDPLEVWTNLSRGRSRLVDLWSFGCVLLESVIWLMFGLDELCKFKSRTTGIGSLYWTVESIHNRTAKLNELTFEWLDRLLKDDPECRASKRGSAMRDLILLIKKRLLLIELPTDSEVYEEGRRINSKLLVQELDDIIQKGTQDRLYLFSGFSRSDIAAPEIAQVPGVIEQEKNQYLSPDVNLSAANVAQNKASTPWQARYVNDSYLHDFDDKWQYVDDTSFTSKIIHRLDIGINRLLPEHVSSLCGRCETLDFSRADIKIKWSLAELRTRARNLHCEFCALLLRTADKSPNKDSVEFDKFSSGLRMNRTPGLPALTIRRTAGRSEPSNKLSTDIHIGIPNIPRGGSTCHFDLMKAWLDDCDQNHPKCQSTRSTSFPTRVIEVGTIARPSLRLVESSSLSETDRNSLKYIALSYPWGQHPPHQHFVTDNNNVEKHKGAIPDSFPKTLADAVKTARYLNIPYLWIDSLCIIQGPGGDFAREADRMEAVFSSAYCVIAATSADGSSSGFLDRDSIRDINVFAGPNNERRSPVFFRNHGNGEAVNSVIFVDEPFDDFDRDVLKGPLNQRGWVFQERALARRMIHFTKNQTYWECGEGIRCETLTKLKNTRVAFLGDPNFPSYGMHGGKGGDIAFYEDLYEQYSRLSFSKIEDRPFAISGLEQRLSQALKEKGRSDRGYWGIFDNYWGRGLLWRRAADTDRMVRLTSGPSGGAPAPSWSWEGYSGAITFMKPEPHTVEWLSREVSLPWSQTLNSQAQQMTTASYHGERCLKGMARDFVLPKNSGDDPANHDIIYDDEAGLQDRGDLKVLIIGLLKVKGCARKNVRNYVLILARKRSASYNIFERVGAGFMDGSLINFDENAQSVSIE